MTIGGSATDYSHLRIHLARQVFIRLRSLSRDATSTSSDPQLDFFPGLRDAGDVACEIAAAGFFVRCVRYVEPAMARWRSQDVAASVLAVAWESAGHFGRHWINSLAEDTSGVQADGIFEPHLADSRNAAILDGLRAQWREGIGALSTGDLSRFRVPVSTVGLCDYLALSGLCEIYRLGERARTGADGSGAPAPEVWTQVKVVSDTCHRLPVTWDPPTWMANLVLRSSFRDAWLGASDPGRAWLAEAIALAGPRHRRLFSRLAGRADRSAR